MTKSDIINEISRKTDVDKALCHQVAESFMETVKGSIESNKNVYLRGFGTFQVKRRAAKVARNISENTSIVVPEHNIPAFKPAKRFIAKVKEQTK